MPLTTPPTAPSPGQDPDVFNENVEARLAWEETFVDEMNVLIPQIETNASNAVAAASTAVAKRNEASNFRDDAEGYKNDAETAAGVAVAAATATAAVSGTSVTSLAIGTGNKTFATQSGRQWLVGIPIIAVDQADENNYMHGTVATYSGTSLTIAVTSRGGAGTVAAWNISVAGPPGATGATGPIPGYLLYAAGIR